MDNLQAYNQFWNSFGLVAYDENSVPEKTAAPYITYEAAADDFGTEIPLAASIWYRTTSWTPIMEKSKEISAYIGRGGRLVSYDGGAFWITKGTPFMTRMGDPDDDVIKRILLNITVEFIE